MSQQEALKSLKEEILNTLVVHRHLLGLLLIYLVPSKLFEQVISLAENDAILAQLKRLTPLAKAMLVPDLTEDEIKAALGEDEV